VLAALGRPQAAVLTGAHRCLFLDLVRGVVARPLGVVWWAVLCCAGMWGDVIGSAP